MEKDPDRRYLNGGVLAEDLRRFLNRFAISARRAGMAQRAVKWAKRHPALAGVSAAAVILVMVAGGFAYQARLAQDQLAAQQQRNVLDEALAAAMGGDLEGTEEAIKRAELLKARPSDRFLRGLVAFHRGDYLQAVDQLEQAIALNTKNVAARAMQLLSANYGGLWSKIRSIEEALEKLTPETPEDFLFKALVERESSSQGLQLADAAIGKRPTWAVGYAIRAQIRAETAMDRSDNALAELGEDGPGKALSLYRELAGQNDLSVDQDILCFLGHASEAALDFQRQRTKRPPVRAETPFEKQLADFNSGVGSEEDLLQLAQGSRKSLTFSHWTIGLRRLSRGDRLGATEHFQKCVDLGLFYYFVNNVADAFLARLNRDPNWPP
ncbi:MAG: hypothetical protein O2960_12360 [Verrucomicrobia bacterium]|nr:hypothetical protein [Verrucomicrobiota bacterium]